MTTVDEASEPMALERVRAGLESLTRAQIVEQVTARISPDDAASFAVVSQGLSLEALRFLSARALVRARAHKARNQRGAEGGHGQDAKKR